MRFIINLIIACCLSLIVHAAYANNNIRVIPDSTNRFVQFEIMRSHRTKFKVRLVDQKGKILAKRKIYVDDKPLFVAFQWKGFPEGYYFIKLKSRKEKIKLMFIKK